jgi:SAM-dependent methyltransferase
MNPKAPSGARKKEWFDDDEFWRVLYPFMFPEPRFSEGIQQVAKTITLLSPQGDAVLDLCCGPGRFAVPLALRGYRVTAVDRTKFLLTKARARAKAAQATVQWIRSDMRDFVRPAAFDVVLSMFTSFGYFDDRRDDLLVLRNMLTSLRPGGACLIDVMGKERVAACFQRTTSERLADGRLLVQRHEIFDDWTRIRNEWIVVHRDRARTYSFHHTLYSGQELRDRMEHIGFRDVRLYGDLDGAEYDQSARRLIAVGRRPV